MVVKAHCNNLMYFQCSLNLSNYITMFCIPAGGTKKQEKIPFTVGSDGFCHTWPRGKTQHEATITQAELIRGCRLI